MTTVREATLTFLRQVGTTTVFGNPGSTELPMFRDFPNDFRYVLGLQESIVLAMADGFAQATRNAALVNLHSAAGVGHSLGNLFTAFKNQTPLVITAGQQARGILPFEPFLFAERPTEFPRPYVKWAVEPARARDVPAAIARAYYIAMEPPCGPTFVSVPVDDWDETCELLPPRRVTARNPGDPQALSTIAQALATARKPALVAGAGISRDQAWHEVIRLAEKHSAGVWTAPFAARNGFPEDHTLFQGFLDPSRDAIVVKLGDYDVVLVLGGPLSLYHTDGTGPHLPQATRLFLITDNPAFGSWAPAGDSVVANLKAAVTTLLDGPTPTKRNTPTPWQRPAPLDGSSVTDAFVLQEVARLRPRTSIIVEEAPSSRGAMHDRLPITSPDTFYTCASGGLGHGLPAAIGVALGRPKEKVIAILGDGSAMYAIQGLAAAAQLRLPISFVIVKNNRYEALHSFGKHFGLKQTVGTDLPHLDFLALAAGQGLEARRAQGKTALAEALAWSFAANSPTLVEAHVS
jgi:benzoylformate decarboxylase